MKLNRKNPARRVLIIGQSGVGKTTHFEKLIRKSNAEWEFIFDPEREFADEFGGALCETPEQLAEATAKGGTICFSPEAMFGEDFEAGFAFFCDFVFDFSSRTKGKKVLGTDELQDLIDSHNCPPEFLKILRLGRRRGIDFVGITHAPNLIHNRVVTGMTEFHAFRIIPTKAAFATLGDIGFDAEKIAALPDFTFEGWNSKTGARWTGKTKP